MTIQRAIATIIACTVLLAMIGVSIGYGVGTIAPEYYRSVFRVGRDPAFQPSQVGVGLGLTQGTAGGVFVGLALVALFCWRDIRIQAKSSPVLPPADRPISSGAVAKWLLLTTGLLLALGFFFMAGVGVGGLLGEMGAYHRQYVEEREAIAPALVDDSGFSRIEIREYSGGGAYLMGEVPAPEDLERLRKAVVRALGEARAKEALRPVHVRE